MVLILFLPAMAEVQETTQAPPPSAIAAQNTQPPLASDGPGLQSPLDAMLTEVFGFSDTQLAEFHALLLARGLAVEAVNRLIPPVERALAAAVHTPAPDPGQVGRLYLALDNLRQQRDEIQDAFRTGFGSLLTAEQQQLLDEILRMETLLHAGGMLHQIGL